MSTQIKYKVIDHELSTPSSPNPRTCSTSANLTKKTSNEPGDYGFVAINEPVFLPKMLLEGETVVTCTRCKDNDGGSGGQGLGMTLLNGPYTIVQASKSNCSDYCYDIVGPKKTYNMSDPSAPWSLDRIDSIDYNAKIKLTEKYIVDGEKRVVIYNFEDCGIDPKDKELKIDFYKANCFEQDKKNAVGMILSSPCDKYLTACCNITPRRAYKYARPTPTPSIIYDMNFDFLVTYTSSFKRCYLGGGCTKNWDRLQISQIEKLKEGIPIKIKRFVGNRGDVWWYMDIEIKRTNYKKVRPNDRRPKITVDYLDEHGYTNLPKSICPNCKSDYLFSIEQIEENAVKKVNEILSMGEWDRVAAYPNAKLDEGPFAGKTLIAASSGNEELLTNFNGYLDPISKDWQNEVRNTPRDGIPNLSGNNKTFKIRSVGYLKPNIKVLAQLIPKRTPEKSCFGCGSTWSFSTEKTSFGGGPS